MLLATCAHTIVERAKCVAGLPPWPSLHDGVVLEVDSDYKPEMLTPQFLMGEQSFQLPRALSPGSLIKDSIFLS